jgi:L-rhamnose-H+ transport protein
MTFGKDLERRALAQGASEFVASNAILCLALTAGCLANAGWAAILMQKNRAWGLLSSSKAPASYWAWGTLMGLICFAGFMIYGTGATFLGELGTIIGWPVFMALALITSNVFGAITGEWKGAPKKAQVYSIAGIALLIAAATIINVWGPKQ